MPPALTTLKQRCKRNEADGSDDDKHRRRRRRAAHELEHIEEKWPRQGRLLASPLLAVL
jgi:hypothetical protein